VEPGLVIWLWTAPNRFLPALVATVAQLKMQEQPTPILVSTTVLELKLRLTESAAAPLLNPGAMNRQRTYAVMEQLLMQPSLETTGPGPALEPAEERMFPAPPEEIIIGKKFLRRLAKTFNTFLKQGFSELCFLFSFSAFLFDKRKAERKENGRKDFLLANFHFIR